MDPLSYQNNIYNNINTSNYLNNMIYLNNNNIFNDIIINYKI